jgi:hypothetical protein
LWALNADDEYHEEVRESGGGPASQLDRDLRNLAATQPLVPTAIVARRPAGGAL